MDSVNLDTMSQTSTDDIDTTHGLAVHDRSVSARVSTARHAGDRFGQSKLFDLGQFEVIWEPEIATLWAYLTPNERPNYDMALLRDALTWHDESKRLFDGPECPMKFMVMGSRYPGVFNLGGDLELFADSIMRRDREQLRDYGHRCVEIVDRLWNCSYLPIVNIGLAQGDALGGGLESLMCHDVIVAERQARFGLPEVLFGLFPGMGAYSILARKIGHAAAEKMILSGKIYTAQEMYDMGLVHILADTGEGEAAVRDFIKANSGRQSGLRGIYESGRQVNPMQMSELIDIVDGWVDAALRLTEKDLRLMRRLAAAQSRLQKV